MNNGPKPPFYALTGWLGAVLSPFATDKTFARLMGLGFLAFVLAIVALAFALPGYPYDLIPYFGAALSGTVEQVHQTAWGLVKDSAKPEVYSNLSSADEYRQTQSSNPDAFHSVLPLYAVKIGYITLLQLFGPLIGWLKAAFWSNYIAGLAFGLICFVWLLKAKALQGAAVVAALLLALNYIDMVAYPSPDMFASTLTLAAIFLWTRQNENWAIILLLVAFLFRPDTIIFVFALILACALFQQRLGRWVVLLAALLIASVFIRDMANHPGWWTHYYFSNVRIQNSLENFAPAFSITDWVVGQARGVFMALSDFNWPVILVLLVTAFITSLRFGYTYSNRQSTMLLACLLTIGGKFLVFPLPNDRLYATFLIAGSLIILQVLQPRLS